MKKWMVILLLLVGLILLDQGSKLIISQNYTMDRDAYISITNTVHIHPHLNDEDAVKMMPLAEKLSINVRVLMAFQFVLYLVLFVGVGLLVACCLRFFFWDYRLKRYPRLTTAWLLFFVAAFLCSAFFDELFWGGSLDFICFVKDIEIPVGNHTHLAPRHRIMDLKDLYIHIGNAFMLVRVVLFCISVSAAEKKDSSEGIVPLLEKCKHPLQNLRNMRAKSISNSNKLT